MRGRTPAKGRFSASAPSRHRPPDIRGRASLGFSLVEILIVILIMGLLIGVLGTVVSGFASNFGMTEDQSIARRRAQDVFNILKVPIQNAGLGLPAEDMDYYFDHSPTSGRVPLADWPSPVSLDRTHGTARHPGVADALRVIYSIPSGVKNGPDVRAEFSSETGTGTAVAGVTASVTNAPPAGGFGIVSLSATGGNLSDVRSFVTFPGAKMHPEYVQSIDSSGKTLTLGGKTPYVASADDVQPRNVIRAYHDLYLVRAGVAYVHPGTSTFCFADVTSSDVPNPFPNPAGVASGFRIEGIKAVAFEEDRRSVTVWVVAEGDNATAGKAASGVLQRLRGEDRWKGVAFDPGMYYEEFSMRWRTRNLEIP